MKEILSKNIELSKGRQSQNYTEILTLGEYKLKIMIKRDSYDMQSYAIIKIFSTHTLSWNDLADITYDKMKTKDIAYKNNATKRDFSSDRRQLISLATIILS